MQKTTKNPNPKNKNPQNKNRTKKIPIQKVPGPLGRGRRPRLWSFPFAEKILTRKAKPKIK
jgi:hypothetical protein